MGTVDLLWPSCHAYRVVSLRAGACVRMYADVNYPPVHMKCSYLHITDPVDGGKNITCRELGLYLENFFGWRVGVVSFDHPMVNRSAVEYIGQCEPFLYRHADKIGNMRLLSMLRAKLQNQYFHPTSTPKVYPPEFRPDALNIAVHIRRAMRSDMANSQWNPMFNHTTCELGTTPSHQARCLPLRYTLQIMRAVLADLDQRTSMPKVFYIYSQTQEDAPPLVAELFGAEFTIGGVFLDQPETHTFHAMVEADVLIQAHSLFSYSAALYNRGAVIYDLFWHPWMPGWIKYAVSSGQLELEPLDTLILDEAIGRAAQRCAAARNTTSCT
jgi:hypothetical protein